MSRHVLGLLRRVGASTQLLGWILIDLRGREAKWCPCEPALRAEAPMEGQDVAWRGVPILLACPSWRPSQQGVPRSSKSALTDRERGDKKKSKSKPGKPHSQVQAGLCPQAAKPLLRPQPLASCS